MNVFKVAAPAWTGVFLAGSAALIGGCAKEENNSSAMPPSAQAPVSPPSPAAAEAGEKPARPSILSSEQPMAHAGCEGAYTNASVCAKSFRSKIVLKPDNGPNAIALLGLAFSGPIKEKILHTEVSPYGDLTFVTPESRIRSYTILPQQVVRELRQHDQLSSIFEYVSFFRAQLSRTDQDASFGFGTKLYDVPTSPDLSRISPYAQRFVLNPAPLKFIDCDEESSTSQYHSVCAAPSGPSSMEDQKISYEPTGAKRMHYASVELADLSAEFTTPAENEQPVLNIYHSNSLDKPVARLEYRSEDRALFAVTPDDERYLMGTFNENAQIKDAVIPVHVLRHDQAGAPVSGFSVMMYTDNSGTPDPKDHNIDHPGSNLFVWYRNPYIPDTGKYETIQDAASADAFCQYSRCEPKPVDDSGPAPASSP